MLIRTHKVSKKSPGNRVRWILVILHAYLPLRTRKTYAMNELEKEALRKQQQPIVQFT